MDNRHFIPPPVSRRDFLRRAGNGFGAIALATLGMEQSLRAASAANPLAPKVGHHAARAKRVIFLFMQGGPSQMDLFDYKRSWRNSPENRLSCHRIMRLRG